MRAVALSDKSGNAFLVSLDPATNSELYLSLSEIDPKNVNLVTKVKVETLDRLLEDFDFGGWGYLKIDTEGNDFRVLRGGERQLQKFALIQAELRLDDPEHSNSLNNVSNFWGTTISISSGRTITTMTQLGCCDNAMRFLCMKNSCNCWIEENKPSTWQQIEALDMIKASKREF